MGTMNGGKVPTTKGETSWRDIDAVLRAGFRGLPGGSSLAQLLEACRGVPNRLNVPRLTPALILRWADAHFALTGSWPNRDSGEIPESPGNTWRNIEDALRQKGRGLRGVSSLARLLAKHRGIRNHMDLPRLTLKKILGWADVHFQRTEKWPTIEAGPIADAEGETTWKAIQMALVQGLRGLKGGDSLARLLLRHRGVPRRGTTRKGRMMRRRNARLPELECTAYHEAGHAVMAILLDWGFRRVSMQQRRISGKDAKTIYYATIG
jgi:hypothetical protein